MHGTKISRVHSQPVSLKTPDRAILCAEICLSTTVPSQCDCHPMKPAFSALGQRTMDPPISWLMKMSLDRPRLISLAAGFTDNPSLPVKETAEIVNELLGRTAKARAALQYGATLGDPELRWLTAKRLRAQDDAAASDRETGRPSAGNYHPDRVLITHGSQQLLYLLTECLCDPGDIVLVEDPTYFVYLSILQSHGVRARGISLKRDGIDLEGLERVLESLRRSGELGRVKLLYLVSYFQNPSGVTTSFEKKSKTLKLLRKYERYAGHPIYLLEDGAYRDLHFAGKPVPSALAAAGAADRVLYTGTYSKPFATGIRVGFGVLPAAVGTVVARVKGNHDFGTSHLIQRILAFAISSGRYDEHLAALQKRYARKSAVMTSVIRDSFPVTIEWAEPEGGLYVWARLPARLRSDRRSRLFHEALSRDVLYVPGDLCYADDPSRRKPRCEMRLSFGGASEKNIRTGIKRLGAALHELMAK